MHKNNAVGIHNCSTYYEIIEALDCVRIGKASIGKAENYNIKSLLPTSPLSGHTYVTLFCKMYRYFNDTLLHFITYPTFDVPNDYYELFVNVYNNSSHSPQVSNWYKRSDTTWKINSAIASVGNNKKCKLYWGPLKGFAFLALNGGNAGSRGFLAAFAGYSYGSLRHPMTIIQQGNGFNVTQPSGDTEDYNVLIETTDPSTNYFTFSLYRLGSFTYTQDVTATIVSS